MKIFLVATGLLIGGGSEVISERVQPNWKTCKDRAFFAGFQYNPYTHKYTQIVYHCEVRK